MQDIKQPKQVCLLSTSNIEHIEIWTIMSMQDINTSESRERERRAIANTRDLSRGSSHLFYVPAFTTLKDFHYKDPARSLGVATPITNSFKNSTDPQVPHLFLQEQHTRTRKLVEATTSTIPLNIKLEYLVIPSLDQILTNKGPRGWI